MNTLKSTIEHAANLAYEEDAAQIVGCIDGEWAIAHIEDVGRQAQMTYPKFTVNSGGVDKGHIERGEITEDWVIPTKG